MAGMLPGVECARRRRFHQGGSTDFPKCVARRTELGDPPSVYMQAIMKPISILTLCKEVSLTNCNKQQRSGSSQSIQAGQLGCAAREAKERLDERLKTLKKSDTMRHKVMGIIRPKGREGVEGLDPGIRGDDLPREIFCSTKRGSRRFSWAKLGWKALEHDECAVCLERFKSGDLLVHLPCAHRFHSVCMVPWLECSAQCPCCRMEI